MCLYHTRFVSTCRRATWQIPSPICNSIGVIVPRGVSLLLKTVVIRRDIFFRYVLYSLCIIFIVIFVLFLYYYRNSMCLFCNFLSVTMINNFLRINLFVFLHLVYLLIIRIVNLQNRIRVWLILYFDIIAFNFMFLKYILKIWLFCAGYLVIAASIFMAGKRDSNMDAIMTLTHWPIKYCHIIEKR